MSPKKLITVSVSWGFTLIELIMVIVVLGILAAFVLPRFANLSQDSSDAVVKGIESALRSGVAIARAQYFVSGKPSSVEIAGNMIFFWQDWPHVANGGVAGIVSHDVSALIEGAETLEIVRENTSAGAWIDFRVENARDRENCKVRYTEASSPTDGAVITVFTTGC